MHKPAPSSVVAGAPVAGGIASVARGQTLGDLLRCTAARLPNKPAIRFALARHGAVLVPINFMLNPDEVAYLLRHSQARLLRAPAFKP